MAIPKTAKIVKASDLMKAVQDKHGNRSNPDTFKGYQYAGGKAPDKCWMGVQAVLAGYDAIQLDDNATWQSHERGYYVILNRSIIVAQKEDAKGHVIK